MLFMILRVSKLCNIKPIIPASTALRSLLCFVFPVTFCCQLYFKPWQYLSWKMETKQHLLKYDMFILQDNEIIFVILAFLFHYILIMVFYGIFYFRWAESFPTKGNPWDGSCKPLCWHHRDQRSIMSTTTFSATRYVKDVYTNLTGRKGFGST